MSIMYAEASISEKGTINGTKGDSTGKEVKISKPYAHSKGFRAFIHPTASVNKKISVAAQAIANNNCYGYGQNDRVTGYTATKNAGWDPSKVKTNVNIDCSELVRTAIACALKKDVQDFNTSIEPNVLLSLGFKEVTFSLSSIKEGMILCTKVKGHTVVVVDTDSASTGSSTGTSTGNVHAYYQAKVGDKKYSLITDYNNTNTNGYAGVDGQKITDFALKVSGGTVKYRVHVLGGKWMNWITEFNWNKDTGYAGVGKPIDAIQIVYSGSGKKAMYRVSDTSSAKYGSWVYNNNGYAGTVGKPIDKIQIAIV